MRSAYIPESRCQDLNTTPVLKNVFTGTPWESPGEAQGAPLSVSLIPVIWARAPAAPSTWVLAPSTRALAARWRWGDLPAQGQWQPFH